MKVSMNKTYRTRDGRNVRILCTDAKSERPVIGLVRDSLNNDKYVETWDEVGAYLCGELESRLDLVEVSPYEDWPIDAPVWVIVDSDGRSIWYPRHFAGVNKRGKPMTSTDGRTSFSSKFGKKTTWAEARLASEFTPT